MPEIKFISEWLKIGDNVQAGDHIQFLDVGAIDEETGAHVFNVAVFRNGELVEATKKFRLNKSNFKEVNKLYGSNSDNWLQKEMMVAKIKVNNPSTGERVDSIALEAPAK